MGAVPFEIELDRASQVAEHGVLSRVRVGQDFAVEVEVAGFLHVQRHGVEEP